jgi:hypothetical protein
MDVRVGAVGCSPTFDGFGTPYVGTVLTTLNPGAAYAVQTKSTQVRTTTAI